MAASALGCTIRYNEVTQDYAMPSDPSLNGASLNRPELPVPRGRLRWLVQRVWHSPTMMTWGSIGARVLSLVLVLPLILTRFPADQVALWYLFSTITGLQILIDLGFTPTTGRMIGFGMAGASTANLKDMRDRKAAGSGVPDENVLGEIVGTMRPVYLRLTLAGFLLLATLGTLAVWRPVHASSDPETAWIAWAVVAGTSAWGIWNGVYASYLQGVNEIALLRRWEIATSLATTLTAFLVLLLGGGLLELVIANQAWMLISMLRNRALCESVRYGRYRNYAKVHRNSKVMDAIWPSAWRTGIGAVMSFGIIQSTGILYAQFAGPAEVATYLLALRMISVVSQFSQAPFYSKLPMLARRRAEGKIDSLLALSRRGMLISYWTFLGGFIAIGLLADPLLALIGSNVPFASPQLWAWLGLAFFVERFGGMHVQVYSTTNHIISHIANSVTGAIVIAIILTTYGFLGVHAFPIGILLGYLAFFCWYAARHSYASTGTTFWKFESSVAMWPALVLTVFCLIRIFA